MSSTMAIDNDLSASIEVYNFVVVCNDAQDVFLLGDFNDWSTSATRMELTEEHIWQLSLELPRGDHHFSYFVVDRKLGSGQVAPFGNTYFLPGTWGAVIRSSPAMDADHQHA
jgi:1,4-alpha-glucan branching enzyme